MSGMKTTDFDDKKLKTYIEFESCEQLTVGELKKRLEAFSDDALVYVEHSNTLYPADPKFAQKALDTYPCERIHRDKEKAMMIVVSMR